MTQRKEITPELIETMRQMKKTGKSRDDIADELGLGTGTVSRHTAGVVRGTQGDPIVNNDPNNVPTHDFNENVETGTAVLVVKTEKPISTYEDALKAANVDLNVWYVDRWEKKTWTVPMRIRQGQNDKGRHKPDKPIQTQQHGIRLYLRRIVRKDINDMIDGLYDRYRKHTPKYKPITYQKRQGEPCMAVFGLFDVHFGKLAWRPETGQNYDLDIAEKVFRNAVSDLLAESAYRNITKIVLPIGNDFFHIDNKANTTVNGTPQDVDGRYAKIFEVGCQAVIWAIELLMQTAPVEVVWVPGNHDPTVSYHLAKTIEAWFRGTKGVTVNAGATFRKYIQNGCTLLGFTHGDQEALRDLPDIMANERPADWQKSICREWLIGHWHSSKKYVTKESEQHRSTVVRVLRSLSSVDAWHYRRGFVCGDRAAEVYFYGETRGYCGHAIVSARQ